jgi:ketosteroid isomerase-like protein
MLDRTEILHTIDEAYATRMRGDKARLATLWADGATYRLVGDASNLGGFPCGPADASSTAEALIDLVRFHKLERLNAVIEGGQAAVLWRVTASIGEKEPATTEMYDLWTFNEDGKARSLLQFTDTALLASMLA